MQVEVSEYFTSWILAKVSWYQKFGKLEKAENSMPQPDLMETEINQN